MSKFGISRREFLRFTAIGSAAILVSGWAPIGKAVSIEKHIFLPVFMTEEEGLSSYSDTDQVTIVPIFGNNIVPDPGLETWASPTNLTYWIETKSGTSTIEREDTLFHSGAHAMKMIIDGSGSNASISSLVSLLKVHTWYLARVWARSDSGTPSIILGPSACAEPGGYSKAIDTTYRQYAAVRRSVTNTFFSFGRGSGSASLIIYQDDLELLEMSLADLILPLRMRSVNYAVKCNLTLPSITREFQGGVCASVDSNTNPQNGVFAYHDGTQLFLEKMVAGVWTMLLKVTVTYGATYSVEIRKSGTSYALWYNNAQLGATQTISDATIIDNHYFGRFSTGGGTRLDSLSILPYPFEDGWVNPYPDARRFVWISDVHRVAIYENGSWSDVIQHIKVIDPEFVVDTGDLTAESTAAEFTDYNLERLRWLPAMAWHTIPGNHDEGAGLNVTGDTAGQTATWDTYDAAGFSRHFTADIGNFRIIGINDYMLRAPAVEHDGMVSAEEKAWILNELANLDGKTPIMACHHTPASIQHGGSWNTIMADLQAAGVNAWLAGHSHDSCSTVVSQGVTTINGASVQGAYNVPGANGMMVWYVFADRMELQYTSARSPWGAFDVTTHPAYTTVVIYRS